MTDETSKGGPEARRAIDTQELRQIIREEFKAHYQDYPGRDEVHKMIQHATGQVRYDTETMVNARIAPLENRMDNIQQGVVSLQQALSTLVDMAKATQAQLQALHEAVNTNLKAAELRMASFQVRVDTLDTRQDLIEPVVRNVQDTIFGTLDGTPGVRARLGGVEVAQTGLIADVGVIKAWVEQQKARERERIEAMKARNERLWAVASNPWLWRLVMTLLALALGIEVTQLIGEM